jgi:RNA polymerase sigma-70 factor (ECF subfamily)
MKRPDFDDSTLLICNFCSVGSGARQSHGSPRRKLHLYLFRCLRDEEDAADLAQETFLRVYQHRGRYDSARRFSTWLFAIAANLVKDRFRWRVRHPVDSMDADHEATGEGFAQNLPIEGPSPSEDLQHQERSRAVLRAISNLPDELRQPLILAEYAEHSQAEIAVILGCTVKAVETRIYRARRRLRADLIDLLPVL